MRSRLLLILAVLVFIISCYAVDPYVLKKAKKHLIDSSSFAYLNKSNKMVSFYPIREYSYLNKINELYLVFYVNYLNFKYPKKIEEPDNTYINVSVHYLNGTTINYDLSDEVSTSDTSSNIYLPKSKFSNEIAYIKKNDPIMAYFNISLFGVYFNIGKYPFLVNFSGDVKYYTLNVTLCKNNYCSTNIINVFFNSNSILTSQFVGKLEYLSSNGNYYMFNISLPKFNFVKISNHNLKDLFLLGLNKTGENNISIPPGIVSSLVKINKDIYLMYETKVNMFGQIETGSGYGFIAICSDPETSGYYNIPVFELYHINSYLCNPTYLNTVTFSYNIISIPKFVKHDEEKEPLYNVRKIVILPKEYCDTDHWALMVASKVLLKKPPYLYLKYVSNTRSLQDKSETLPYGLTAYKNLLNNFDIDVETKQKIIKFWTKFKENTYGYLYTDIIKISPEIIVDHDNQCILIFNYSFTLFGLKPSELSIFLVNLNKELLKNSAIINTIILQNDLKQGFLRIIEGKSLETLYIYSVSVEPYPTSLNNENLYVFKFTPVIRKTYALMPPVYTLVLYLVSGLATSLAGVSTYLGQASEYALESFEKMTTTISKIQDSLGLEIRSLFETLATTNTGDEIGACIFVEPKFLYKKLFADDDAIYKEIYKKIYKGLLNNEQLREKVFNELKTEISGDKNLENIFKKAFGDNFIKDLNSENYVGCLMDMFKVNRELGIAVPKIDTFLDKNEFNKLMNTLEDSFGTELSINIRELEIGFNFPNVLLKGEPGTVITDFYNSIGYATEEDFLDTVYKKIILFGYKKFRTDAPQQTQEFLDDVIKKLKEGKITLNSIEDLDKLGAQEFAKESFVSGDLSKIESLLAKDIYKPVLTAKYKALGEEIEEQSVQEKIENEANSLAQETENYLKEHPGKPVAELFSKIFNNIPGTSKVLKFLSEHPDFAAYLGRAFTGALYGFAAVQWMMDAIQTSGYINNLIKEWQQLYNYNITYGEGYLPLVLVNFNGRSFPVPILFNVSLFHNISYNVYVSIFGHKLRCAISNLKSFGGLFIGNSSSLSSINQYLPPMGMLPDFYTEPPSKNKIGTFITGVKESFDLGMFSISAIAASLSLGGVELSTIPVIEFLMLDPVGIGLVIVAGLALGYLFTCTNLFYIPYHQFLKLLGVNTFVINSELLFAKENKIGKYINSKKPLIEFYINNTSYERLLKQICIYGYLGKWNSTTHMCFAGALFNNTPFIDYVNNNNSFYYGPIPSRVLLDSGDVYVGILSLPMALTRRNYTTNINYTYSNKELFDLLNGIWSYFKKSNHPNLKLFINWVEQNPNLDKNYGLMAILAAYQKGKYNIMAYLIAGACLGYVVQDFGINNNQSIDKAVCEKFVSKCLPSYVEILNNLTTMSKQYQYAPLLSGNPTSPIATTNNTKIEFSNNISVRAFNSTDYIAYAPLIVLYARMTPNDKIQVIKVTYDKDGSVSKTFEFPIYMKMISIYLDVIGQGPKGYFHSVASDLYNDPNSPIPKSKFKLITIDGQKVPLLPVIIYNISNASIYSFNFPLQYLYYIGKEKKFNINVTKQIEYLIVNKNHYYGIFKTIFNTKDVLTDQGIPDYWPNENQKIPVIKPRPNFIRIVPPSDVESVMDYLDSDHYYTISGSNAYISAGLLAENITQKICSDNQDVCKLMLNPGEYGLSTNVLALVKNNVIILYAMKGFVGFDSPSYWKKFEVLKPTNSFYDIDLKTKTGGVCVLWWCNDKITYPPTFELIDKPYEFQGYFEVQVLVPKTELSEMLTYCSSKYKNCKIALVAIPS